LIHGEKINSCKVLISRKKTRFLQIQSLNATTGKFATVKFPASIGKCNFSNDGCFKAKNGYFSFNNSFLVNLRLLNLNSKDTLVVLELMDGRKALLAFENEKKLGKLLVFLKNYDKLLFNNFKSERLFHSENLFKDQEELGFILGNSAHQRLQLLTVPKTNFKTVYQNICALNVLFSKLPNARFCYPQFPRLTASEAKLNSFPSHDLTPDIAKLAVSIFCQRIVSIKKSPERLIVLKNLQFYSQLLRQDEFVDSPMTIQDWFDNPDFVAQVEESENENGLTQRTYLSENNRQTRRLANLPEKGEAMFKAPMSGLMTSVNKNSKPTKFFGVTPELHLRSGKKEPLKSQKVPKSPSQTKKNQLKPMIDPNYIKESLRKFKTVYNLRKMIEKKSFAEHISHWFRLFLQVQGKNTLLLRGLQVTGPMGEFFVYNRANTAFLKEVVSNLTCKSFSEVSSKKTITLSFEFPEALMPKKVLFSNGYLLHVVCHDLSLCSLMINRDQEYISSFKTIKIKEPKLNPFKILKYKVF